MLFGPSNKIEEIRLEKLDDALNIAFNGKLNNLEAKASRIIKDLSNVKAQFTEACDKFERLEAEPENENIYIDTASFVKSQKGYYSKTLKSLINEWGLYPDEPSNIHNKYDTILANTENFINGILQTNNRFKKVLYSYADHLDLFKKYFSMIERYRDSLKNEIARTENEFVEYNNLNEKIIELTSLMEEFQFINKNITSLNETIKFGNSDEKSNEQDVQNELLEKEKELSGLNQEISTLRNRITSSTLPLERPSRKLDHISSRKRQLHTFITDPISNINSEQDMNEFRVLLEELKKSVQAGTIDVKNNARTSDIASEILKIDLYGMITDLKTLQTKKNTLQDEIKFLQNIMSKLKETKNSSKKTAEEMDLMKKRQEELNSKIKHTKSGAESLFLQYYKKRLSIVYD